MAICEGQKPTKLELAVATIWPNHIVDLGKPLLHNAENHAYGTEYHTCLHQEALFLTLSRGKYIWAYELLTASWLSSRPHSLGHHFGRTAFTIMSSWFSICNWEFSWSADSSRSSPSPLGPSTVVILPIFFPVALLTTSAPGDTACCASVKITRKNISTFSAKGALHTRAWLKPKISHWWKRARPSHCTLH